MNKPSKAPEPVKKIALISNTDDELERLELQVNRQLKIAEAQAQLRQMEAQAQLRQMEAQTQLRLMERNRAEAQAFEGLCNAVIAFAKNDENTLSSEVRKPASLGKPANEASRRDLQVNLIIKAAQSLGFELMAIPRNGKRRVYDVCVEADKDLIHANSWGSAFKGAWQKALNRGCIKSVVKGGRK